MSDTRTPEVLVPVKRKGASPGETLGAVQDAILESLKTAPENIEGTFQDSVSAGGVLRGMVNQFGAVMARLVESETASRKLALAVQKCIEDRIATPKSRRDGWELRLLERRKHEAEATFAMTADLSVKLSREIRAWRKENMRFVPIDLFFEWKKGLESILRVTLPQDPNLRKKIGEAMQTLASTLLPFFLGDRGADGRQ